MDGDEDRMPNCAVCGSKMVEIRGCHYQCMNCGREIDCSDPY